MKKDESIEKVIAALEAYDEKIDKTKKELKKYTDKRETLYLRTIADGLKNENLSVREFFRCLGKIKQIQAEEKAENTKINAMTEKTDNTNNEKNKHS